VVGARHNSAFRSVGAAKVASAQASPLASGGLHAGSGKETGMPSRKFLCSSSTATHNAGELAAASRMA
jgi:hypothetical protein